MHQKQDEPLWRWASLITAVFLLAACLFLLGGQGAAAQPPPGTHTGDNPASLPSELAGVLGSGDRPTGVQAGFDLLVSAWHMGNYARPGGVEVYGIYYGNDFGSDDAAENVIIVDTLPPGTTYAGDTSGVEPIIGASGVVTWELGLLNPGDEGVFMLTVNVPPDAPNGAAVIAPNCVLIDTTSAGEWDPGSNEGCSDPVDVWDDDVEIEVFKGPEPGDPAPGQAFDYVIQWCNHRGAAAGPVVLTDTLPTGTTFVEWGVRPWWQRFWNEVSTTGGELVLEAPGLPGDMCQELQLRLALDPDAVISTTLENLVVIAAEGDVNPETDSELDRDGHVSESRPDLAVDKWFNTGVLAPGGWIGYGVEYRNQGNVAVNAVLTDSLTPGTEYIIDSALMYGEPFDPAFFTADHVVWELGTVGVNERQDFSFEVAIDALASPGVYENCVQIAPDVDETSPWDNEWCTEVEVFASGPNLHVEKYSDWQQEQINYQIFVANMGDQHVSTVHMTDTYPIGTTAADPPNAPGHLSVAITPNHAENQWLFLIQDLGPGEAGWFDFNVTVDDPDARPAFYTNTVEIEIFPGEANPDDNHYDDLIVIPEVEEVEIWLDRYGQSSMWGQAQPGVPLTVTTPNTQVVTLVGNGECPSCWNIDDTDMLNPGDVIVVEAGDGLLPVVIEVPDPFTAEIDRGAGTVSGQIGGWLEMPVQVRGWWEGGQVDLVTDGFGNYEAVYDQIPPGAEGVTFFETEANYARVTFRRHFRAMDLLLQVNYDHDWIQGNYEPGHTVWLTVEKPTQVYTIELQTEYIPWWDNFGFSSDWSGEWHPEPPDLAPGDLVSGRVATGYAAELQIGEITGSVYPDADTVEGSVFAGWLGVPEVDVQCHPWGGPPEAPSKWSVAGTGGDPAYSCSWDPGTEWDMHPGQQVAVSYIEPAGHEIYAVFESPWMSVNYGQDWVGGNYEADHTFVITVTGSGGVPIKGIAEIDSTPGGGWGGSGFQTDESHWQGPWFTPDIEIYDEVHFASDDGYRHTVEVGGIGAGVNAGLDRVTGLLNVPWLVGVFDQLPVECHPWGGPQEAPVKEDTAPPDSTAPFSCEWDPDTEWDIQPGQDVGVMYIEPDDGDRVVNVFSEPAPDMQVEKWVEGSDQVAPGGPMVFGIRFRNQGDGDGFPVIVTDTLPADTYYVADSSGVPHSFDGDMVIWDFGLVGPDEEFDYQLVLANTTVPGGPPLLNQVDIWAPYDRNEDDNHAEAMVHVADVGPDLYVNKNPQPGDPAPGSTYLYEIDYGNNGPAATGPVVLTDILPAGTSVVDWYSQNGYALWTEVSRNGQLVLEAPAIPGQWGDRIMLRLEVQPDVEIGTQLTNTVQIESPDSYAEHMRDDVWVGEPRWDSTIQKGFNWGVLVPDGEMEYSLHVRNNGNMGATTRLTDTLQGVFGYVTGAWCNDGEHGWECPPDDLGYGSYAWDLGEMAPGAWVDVNLQVHLWSDVPPGYPLVNCAEIGIDGPDGWPFDNSACAETEYVQEFGPNLRVTKEHEWQDENDSVLRYSILVQNLGTERLENVLIHDLYPEGTAFLDEWGVDHGPWIELDSHDGANRLLTFWADAFNPGDTARINFRVHLDDPDARPAFYLNSVEVPVDGDVTPDDNYDEDLAVKTEVQRVELWVEPASHSSMWGDAVAGTVLTVTTPHTEVTTLVGGDGCDTCWQLDVDQLDPGDPVVVKAGAGLLPVNIEVPDPFVAEVDTTADEVLGQIGGWTNESVEIHGNWPGGNQVVPTDGTGNYLAAYDDIPRGADGYVRFVTEADYAEVIFHRPFYALDLVVQVNYGHDWVEGNYEPGHTVLLTVTNGIGEVKATAELETQEIPGWDGGTGFSTSLGEPWVPERPDIQDGDWVYGRVVDVAPVGPTTDVHVGNITGSLDVELDTIEGDVFAKWFAGTMLPAWCSVWEDGGPQRDFEVDPDGGPYFCDLRDMGWDLEPGHNVAVGYVEPDGDQVINVFYEPAPDMQVEKWSEGSDQFAPGGTAIFNIRYRNGGEGLAETVLLTDTLPPGTSYVDDSLGAPHTIDGNQVIWELGSVDAGEEMQFQLVLSIPADPEPELLNQVDVWAAFDTNPDDNHAEARIYRNDAGPDLGIGKQAEPNRPAAGYTYLYTIDYGNNSPAPTGPVVLTDDLPTGTSIDSWYSENGYSLWTDASTADQLILEAPALPGQWGDRIMLRLRVDGGLAVDTQLTNTVEIATDGSYASFEDTDVWVGEPFYSSHVDKSFGWGVLVPGGEIEYGIHVRNGGNIPTPTWLTDTLPTGTHLLEAWLWDGREQSDAPPDDWVNGNPVWDLGAMLPGAWVNLNVRLAIEDVAPGHVLTNCVEIGIPGPDWPVDNQDCVVDWVRPEGPNLRVVKEVWWDGEGQLHYAINLYNLGSERLEDVWFTDTYPEATVFTGDWGVSHGPWIELISHDEPNRQLNFWAEKFDKGETARIEFQVGLDQPGVHGQYFVNAVEAPIPGDVWPEDNYDEVTAYTGPDLWVEKALSDGEPRPGEVVTFTVQFGNKNVWPWDGDPAPEPPTFISDTLPAGMTFLTATAPWNPDEPWYPDEIVDNTHIWHFGPVGNSSWWEFQIVAQINGDVPGGEVLTNTIEIVSNSPTDVDPDYDNNSSKVPLTVLAPVFEVVKTYDTSRVAGTILTYTLSVANVGNAAGTNVVLEDTLPAGLTYDDGDGSYDGLDITWSLGTLEAGGDPAGGWFRGILPCTAEQSIVNDEYGVISSDQGVTASGATVSLDTLAPTIGASLAYGPALALVDETIHFTATVTSDGVGMDSYAWDFGQGPEAGGLTASHVYAEEGTYTVHFTATDQCGFAGTGSLTFDVVPSTVYVYLPIVLRNH